MRKHQAQLEAYAKAQAVDAVFYKTPKKATFDSVAQDLQSGRTFSMHDVIPWEVYQDQTTEQLAQTLEGKYGYTLEALEFAYDLAST